MLSNAMRGHILASVRRTLTDTCNIEKPGSATDKIGGGKPTWIPVQSNVACRVINNLRGQESEAGDQPSDDWDMTLITLKGVELKIGYRVLFGNEVYYVTALKGHLTDAVDQQATIGKKQ